MSILTNKNNFYCIFFKFHIIIVILLLAKKKVDDVLDSMSGTDRLDKLAGIGGVTQLLVNGDERLETLLVDQSTIDYYIGKLTSVSDEQTASNANERKSERVLAQQIVALLTTTNAVVGKCYTQSTVLDELFSPLKSESISPFLLAVLSKVFFFFVDF